MAVCWEFAPIIWWQGLPDEAQAAWASAFATIFAAAIAVGIYAIGRWHQRRDLVSRSAVLHAILADRLRNMGRALNHIRSSIEVMLSDPAINSFYWFEIDGYARIEAADRLVELQKEVANLGIKSTIEVVRFIELCHIYNERVEACRVFAFDIAKKTWAFDDLVKSKMVRIHNLLVVLNDLESQHSSTWTMTIGNAQS